jgi:putative transposase
MSNHIHGIVIPPTGAALPSGVGTLHRDFSRLQNIRCGRTGHLWQNRFFSCPVQFDRVWDVLAYVELNPVRAHIVEKPAQYQWSSGLVPFS